MPQHRDHGVSHLVALHEAGAVVEDVPPLVPDGGQFTQQITIPGLGHTGAQGHSDGDGGERHLGVLGSPGVGKFFERGLAGGVGTHTRKRPAYGRGRDEDGATI